VAGDRLVTDDPADGYFGASVAATYDEDAGGERSGALGVPVA
jgi:hypothetical protein